VSIYTKKKVRSLADEEIVELIMKSGNPEFFEEIYERYAKRIFSKCLSFSKDRTEAMDLAHDVLIKIYLNLSKYKKKAKFSTWIYAITYNFCVDYQVKKKKQMTILEELKNDGTEITIQNYADEELEEITTEKLKQLLEKVSLAEKTILLMMYQDNFSIKEIAKIIGTGESAVKMKLLRSKAKLMKLYEEGR
jgi:RNA polymerase sigma factor (sigma-70 family)